MPETRDIPKGLKKIADDIDAGRPPKDYKPEVLDAIYKYVKTGEGGDNPAIKKMLSSFAPPAPPPPPPKTAEQIAAEDAFNKDLQGARGMSNPDDGIQRYNDAAKFGYYRRKITEELKKRNPEAWAKIEPKWKEQAMDPTRNNYNAQARGRVAFDADQGKTRLSEDEVKAITGKDYEEFKAIRNKYAWSNNNGISRASMDGFGFEDLSPLLSESSVDSNGQYYKPEYDGNELYVDTNIPSLSHLVKKKKPAVAAAPGQVLAKQQP